MKVQLLRRAARDTRGNAIVEFGLLAPVLAGVIALIGEYGVLAYTMHNMRGGVHAGAQYVMGGSRTIADIKAVALSAWAGKPDSGATVDVTQFFKCGESAGTEGTLCAGTNKLPEMYFKVKATSEMQGIWEHALSAEEVVRVR
jgi:Flp pilus assembly protein TadG